RPVESWQSCAREYATPHPASCSPHARRGISSPRSAAPFGPDDPIATELLGAVHRPLGALFEPLGRLFAVPRGDADRDRLRDLRIADLDRTLGRVATHALGYHLRFGR